MNEVQRDCLDALNATVVVNMQQAETLGAFGRLFHAGMVTGLKWLHVRQMCGPFYTGNRNWWC